MFSELYGLHNMTQTGGTIDADIDAPEAWDINFNTGSSDVIVAVIDSGVDYDHPELALNMWVNGGETPDNDTDDDGNGFIDDVRGWDFVNNDNDPMDDYGHGTHCAGTIGAVGDNGIGVAGVNWEVTILPVKFLGSSGSGSTSNAVNSVYYAMMMGADVMSNSWGGVDIPKPWKMRLPMQMMRAYCLSQPRVTATATMMCHLTIPPVMRSIM
jgi:subtilisin family serine protease